MKRRSMLMAGAILPVIALASSCGAPDEATKPKPEDELVELQADYPMYDSVDDAALASSLIVSGKTLASRSEMEVPIGSDSDDPNVNPQAGADDVDPKDLETPVTISTFLVEEIIKGEGVDVGDEIEVSQLGGEVEGVKYVESGATYISEAGDAAVVLFLSREGVDEGPYYLINSQQGAFERNAEELEPIEGTEGIKGLSTLDQVKDTQ